MNPTPVTLTVIPLNEEKLLQRIRAEVKMEDPLESLHIRTSAIAAENIFVNKDCCYGFMEKRYQSGKIQFVYDVPVRVRKKTPDGEVCPMCPSFYFPIGIEELRNYYLATVSLKDYMGQRFDYNPRIKTNMNNFLNDEDLLAQLANMQ